MNLQSFGELVDMMQREPRVAIFVGLGLALILLLLIVFIQTLTSPKSKTKSFSPADPKRIIQYAEKLYQVSEDGKSIIEYLEHEVQARQTTIDHQRQTVQELQNQKNELEERLRMYQENTPELLKTLDEKQKYEQNRLRKQYRQVALRKWFWGFVFGLFLSASLAGAYYYSAELQTWWQTFMSNFQK